jgi:hypothetical protein
MTKKEMSEIKDRMKHLARKFCRRNNVYTEFDSSVGKLIEKSYLSAYLLCLHENKNKIAELEAQVEKMKRHSNCKYRSEYSEEHYK